MVFAETNLSYMKHIGKRKENFEQQVKNNVNFRCYCIWNVNTNNNMNNGRNLAFYCTMGRIFMYYSTLHACSINIRGVTSKTKMNLFEQ